MQNTPDPVLQLAFDDWNGFIAELDQDHSGSISLSEWVSHFKDNDFVLIHILNKLELRRRRVHWARSGTSPDEQPNTSIKDLVHKYKSDFLYFAANQHPLLSIFCAQPYTGLQPWLRLLVELLAVTQAWMLSQFVALLKEGRSCQFLTKFLLGQLFVTIPCGCAHKQLSLLLEWPTVGAHVLEESPPLCGCLGNCVYRFYVVSMMFSSFIALCSLAYWANLSDDVTKFVLFRCVGYVQWIPVTFVKDFLGVSFLIGCSKETKWDKDAPTTDSLKEVNGCKVVRQIVWNTFLPFVTFSAGVIVIRPL